MGNEANKLGEIKMNYKENTQHKSKESRKKGVRKTNK